MAGYVIKASLLRMETPVWRRIVIPSDITFQDMDDILRIAFGWSGAHAHRFKFPVKEVYALPDEFVDGGSDISEAEALVDDAAGMVRYFMYRYDLGDCWDHKVVFEKAEREYSERYAKVLKYKGDNYQEDTWDFQTVPFDLEWANERLAGWQFSNAFDGNQHELKDLLSARESLDDEENHWWHFCAQWVEHKEMPKNVEHAELVAAESCESLRDMIRGRDGRRLLFFLTGDFHDELNATQARDLYVQKLLENPALFFRLLKSPEEYKALLTIADAEYNKPVVPDKECSKKYDPAGSQAIRACIMRVEYKRINSTRRATVYFASDFLAAWQNMPENHGISVDLCFKSE